MVVVCEVELVVMVLVPVVEERVELDVSVRVVAVVLWYVVELEKVVLEIDDRGLQIPNGRFDQFMCACIMLNMLALSLDHYDSETGDPVELLAVIDKINLGFTVVFLIEMSLKILALGVRRYFAEAMNVLDAFSVITGLMEKSTYIYMLALRCYKQTPEIQIQIHV